MRFFHSVIKVKIVEGVLANQDVIVLDEEEEDPKPIKLPPFKRNKRAAPNAKSSTAVTKKSKTRPISGSSDSGDEDVDQDQGANQSGRGNGKGKEKEKARETEGNQPEKIKGVVGPMRKWEPASACLLAKKCNGLLKEFFRNVMGELTKNGGNSSHSGHDLGVISNFLDFLLLNEPYCPKDHINIRNNLTSQLVSFSKSAVFHVFLQLAPALMQVTHPDPSWNRDAVNFEKIYDAAQEEEESPNGSWTSVLAMFTWADKDNTITYTAHK